MNLRKHKHLIADLSSHAVVTFILGLLLYNFTNNVTYFFLCILGGILIDLDHFFDYFMYFGLNFNLSKFFKSDVLKFGKCYLFFHSWELLIILFIFGFYFSYEAEMFALSLGITGHLIIDSLFQKVALPYFLIYRIYHKFESGKILPCCKNSDFTCSN